MFIDASAMVAIIAKESDATQLMEQLEAAAAPITSAVAIFEAALALRREFRSTVEEARKDVQDFLDVARIVVIPITAHEAGTALDAFSRYGKGQGHPAQLNMGDCFAYAVAKNHRTTLLYKGNDFGHTDIRGP
jgi:ribonuclease VapC